MVLKVLPVLIVVEKFEWNISTLYICRTIQRSFGYETTKDGTLCHRSRVIMSARAHTFPTRIPSAQSPMLFNEDETWIMKAGTRDRVQLATRRALLAPDSARIHSSIFLK
jgi:hypothetical protein